MQGSGGLFDPVYNSPAYCRLLRIAAHLVSFMHAIPVTFSFWN